MNLSGKLMAVAVAFAVPFVSIADTITIPAGTVVYGEIQERVVSKRKETSEGDIVRAHAWRNVVVDGRTVIPAGSAMLVRVSKVKKAKFAGIKGKLELEAVSVRGADSQDILLDGGYDKSGKGRKALAISLAALVAWPVIFVKGKQAVLDPGTVFDSYVQADYEMEIVSAGPPKVKIGKSFEVEVLYDEMDPEGKSKLLPVRMKRCDGPAIKSASVVTVNEQDIPPIPVELTGSASTEECFQADGQIDLKALASHFTRGINRFEVEVEGLRDQVILDIEM